MNDVGVQDGIGALNQPELDVAESVHPMVGRFRHRRNQVDTRVITSSGFVGVFAGVQDDTAERSNGMLGSESQSGKTRGVVGRIEVGTSQSREDIADTCLEGCRSAAVRKIPLRNCWTDLRSALPA